MTRPRSKGPLVLSVERAPEPGGGDAPLSAYQQRVRDLPIWPRIYDRLCTPMPLAAIARWIRDEEGYLQEWEVSTIANRLGELRARIPPADLLVQRDPSLVADARKEFSDRLAGLRALERLLAIHWARIDEMRGSEMITGKLDGRIVAESRVISDIITRMHGIALDLGLTGSRDLGTLTVSAEQIEAVRARYGERAAQAFADPVRRERVLSVVKQAMRVAEAREAGEAIRVTPAAPTGEDP